MGGERRPLDRVGAGRRPRQPPPLRRSGLIEDLREPARAESAESLPERSHRWLRIPLFLHLCALKVR